MAPELSLGELSKRKNLWNVSPSSLWQTRWTVVWYSVPDTHTLPKTSNYWFIQSTLTSITVSERFSRPQGMKPLQKTKADWDPDRLPFWHHFHVLSYHHHNQKDGESHICPVLFASCYWEENRNQSVLFRTNNKHSRSAKGIWESWTTAAFSFFFLVSSLWKPLDQCWKPAGW